ncbi:Fatty acid metabolism regulator protein [Falsiruegeria litorea R37]|uniref:Fatty acid metabolism regulator protein n=1 Tax=Falsiruegeria litorea R37 TaxID=1200284 RepID=A0A1Y5RA95_9RHOB|nr:TetR/AcrR family transcriptional regulator [Falsiruegeria litorea]SLN12737.1 Fatty acid metabolism regulator protein [Falsiruegeria litorea R37]
MKEMSAMRKTPLQPRARAKVEEILAASRQVLVERGFENFTTNHVADAVGCRIGTVYRYFAHKDDIYRRLYDEWLAEEKRVNMQALEDLTEPMNAADLVAFLFRRHISEHTAFDHALAVELTKAMMMNDRIREADKSYEADIVNTVRDNVLAYSNQQFSPMQIKFAMRLAVSLLLMVSIAEDHERKQIEDLAIETLRNTVKSWM